MTRTVALVVTGSIAAYKAPFVARALAAAGVRVLPILTRSAREFVGAATFSGLTRERVHASAFGDDVAGELHVDLATEADLVAVVPATADFLARLAQGRADDLATATCLCARAKVLVAPAMHPRMWEHPATRANVETLRARGVVFVGPVEGPVASGDHGMGRMSEPEVIARAILEALEPGRAPARDLAGRHVVVSAGPSVEDIDPVRFIGNRSTGKMGFAVAARAAARGARVTLVAGPVALPTPAGVDRVDTRGALAMRQALWAALGEDLGAADALVMTAAVGDYRIKEPSATKIKRGPGSLLLELVPNPDLLAEIGEARARAPSARLPVLVGFAVETAPDDAALVAVARGKLEAKRVDLVVANHAAESFGRDDNRAILVTRDDAAPLATMDKTALADLILDRVASLAGDRKTKP